MRPWRWDPLIRPPDGRGDEARPEERYAPFLALAEPLFRAGAPLEAVLGRLREAGATQIVTAYVLRAGGGLTLTEAKFAIDGSETWADQREATERARDVAERALDTLDPGDPSG